MSGTDDELAAHIAAAEAAWAAQEEPPAEPLSPEFRARLIAAVGRPLRVRRAILLLAGHAAGHLPHGQGCRTCYANWPCDPVRDAAREALDAFADCDEHCRTPVAAPPSPVATCEHGMSGPHEYEITGEFGPVAGWPCPGPSPVAGQDQPTHCEICHRPTPHNEREQRVCDDMNTL